MKIISKQTIPFLIGMATVSGALAESEPLAAIANTLSVQSEPNSVGTVHELGTLMVTAKQASATKAITRADLDPASLVNPYRVSESTQVGSETFTREDIKNIQPADINDLLSKAAGVTVNYQGRRSPYVISSRGGGTFTYVLNGAILPPSTSRILYKIPISAIEELQVVRGATSLTLGPAISNGASNSGSGLVTGFIIIRTKRPETTEATVKTSIEKGTDPQPTTTNESLFVGTQGRFSESVDGYVGGLVAKMDKPSKAERFDGQDYEGGMFVSGFHAGKFSANFLAYKDSGRMEMQRGILTDGTLSDSKWYYDPLETSVYSGDATIAWTENQVTLLNLFLTEFSQEEHNEYFSTAKSSTREYDEDTMGFSLRHNARFGDTLVQLGTQMSSSTGHGADLYRKYIKYDTTVYGGAASVEQRLFDGRLVLDAGYREDMKHIDNSSTSTAADAANNDVDLAPSQVFAVGAHWNITDMVAFDGRYYQGEQGTTGDFDMQTEDGSELHPENQKRLELTLSADPCAYLKPSLTWFNVKAENEKTASSTTYDTGSGIYYYYTEEDQVRTGLEWALQGQIGKHTSYKASWTRMLQVEYSDAGVTKNSIGVTKPKNQFSLRVSQQWKAYRANVSVTTVDEWDCTSTVLRTTTSGGLGGYTRVDANIQRDLTLYGLDATVSLYGRNLTDEPYATRYVTGYYYDRGCTIGAELTLSFKRKNKADSQDRS